MYSTIIKKTGLEKHQRPRCTGDITYAAWLMGDDIEIVLDRLTPIALRESKNLYSE